MEETKNKNTSVLKYGYQCNVAIFFIIFLVKQIQGTCCETERKSNTQIPFLIQGFIKKTEQI